MTQTARAGGRQLTMIDSMMVDRRAVPDRRPDRTNRGSNLLTPWRYRERQAWRPPQDLNVPDWAERYRILPAKNVALPGRWQHRAYYTVEPMAMFTDPRVEEITIMASAQSSKTESVNNMIGYAIDQDPGPILYSMPSLAGCEKAQDRLETMIKSTPETASHLTGDDNDLTKKALKLDNLTLHIASAGATNDFRMIEARYLFRDECSGYLPTREGDPMRLLKTRTTSYWNRKIVNVSTVTTEEDPIHQRWEDSDKRKYWVPCPHCGGYQVLSFWRLKCRGEPLGKWPRDKRREESIQTGNLAVYECEHCGSEIDHREKTRMLRRGTWVPEGHPIERDGTVSIPRRTPMHVGYWWSAVYSPWVSWAKLCAEFFAVKDTPNEYKTWVNTMLAEPWKEIIRERDTAEILSLRTERPAFLCPPNTIAVTAGIDNQKSGKWITIWAHTRNADRQLGSSLIRYGAVASWSELERWIFEDLYAVEGTSIMLPVWRGGIDTGGGETDDDATMTEQVYDWLRTNGRGVIYGVKGSSRTLSGGRRMQSTIIDRMPSRSGRPGRPIPGGIKLWLIDTGATKDAIFSRIESDRLDLNADTREDFAKHMTAESKIRDKYGRAVWTLQRGRANHLLDCTVYAHAMADPECDGGVMVLAPPSEPRPRIPRDQSPGPGTIASIHSRLAALTVNPFAGRG